MQYLLLIYEDEKVWPTFAPDVSAGYLAEYNDFTDSVKKAGQYLGGEALQPTTTATTVRVRDGKTMTTDGPFAETREQLGGFYFIEAKDLDEAIATAARIPSARYGSIEVRPVMKFE